MIAIACDHAAFGLKQEILRFLDQKQLAYKDFGTFDEQSVDYPVYGFQAAKAVAEGTCELGILMCGTGVGMSIAANKVKGIRCVVCSEPYSAKMAREHNNANMLAIGARVVGPELAKMIVETFLESSFLENVGNHKRRVDMLCAIEEGDFLADGQLVPPTK